jgi:hypothetical protein
VVDGRGCDVTKRWLCAAFGQKPGVGRLLHGLVPWDEGVPPQRAADVPQSQQTLISTTDLLDLSHPPKVGWHNHLAM